MEGYIYSITNSKTGKVYIGSTVSLEKRWNAHKRQLKNNNHHNRYLQNSYNKYGDDAIKYEMLVCDEFDKVSEIRLLEKMYILIFKTDNSDYGFNNNSNTENNRARSVCSIDRNGNIVNKYETILEAGENVGCGMSAIRKAIDGYSRSCLAKGYRWQYYDRYNLVKYEVREKDIPCLCDIYGNIVKKFTVQKDISSYLDCTERRVRKIASKNRLSDDRKYFIHGYAPIMIPETQVNNVIKTGVKMFYVYDIKNNIEYEFSNPKEALDLVGMTYWALWHKIRNNLTYNGFKFYHKTY